ncbi:hypothetical protein C8Q80DRAFT_1188509 [Daedaleopsis nitida]|nr:hypothetical protein C8Q80DRAFT_1188509 [Daedaleopsis nitida]
MNTAPAATHKRSHEDDMAQSTQAKKPRQGTSEFWADDGNVVLVVRNVWFRVHKSVLAYHSPVIADMFSLPQPADAATSAAPRDCSVVHLDDSPEDLRHFLCAILPRKKSNLVGSKDKPNFGTVSAYARLGHTYQIEHLVAQTVEFLKGFFTDDFDHWDEEHYVVPAGWVSDEVIGVVNMARLLGCHSVLPSALAICCVLVPDALLDGFEREDGSRETLEKSDLIRCLRGKETLAKESVSAVLRAFRHNPPNRRQCERQPCRPWLDVLNDAVSRFPDVFGGVHVLNDWVGSFDMVAGKKADKRLCKSCLSTLTARLRDEQRKIWNRLPELLDIQVDGWGQTGAIVELLDFDAVVEK